MISALCMLWRLFQYLFEKKFGFLFFGVFLPSFFVVGFFFFLLVNFIE